MSEDIFEYIMEGSKDTPLKKRIDFIISLVLDDYLSSIESCKENKHRIKLNSIISDQRDKFKNKLNNGIIDCVQEWEDDGRPESYTDVLSLCNWLIEEHNSKPCSLTYTYEDFNYTLHLGNIIIDNNTTENIIENAKTLRDLMVRPGFIKFNYNL